MEVWFALGALLSCSRLPQAVASKSSDGFLQQTHLPLVYALSGSAVVDRETFAPKHLHREDCALRRGRWGGPPSAVASLVCAQPMGAAGAACRSHRSEGSTFVQQRMKSSASCETSFGYHCPISPLLT